MHPGLAVRYLLCPAVLGLVCGLMTAGVSAEPVHYRTELTPVEDPRLLTALEASSNLLALEQAQEPPAAAGLVRRAVQDRERMWTALRSFGFYAGEVRITIAGLPLDTEHLIEQIEAMPGEGPVVVAIAVEPGPLFTIGSFEVLDAATGQTFLRVEIDRSTLGITLGDPARAATVIGAQGDADRADAPPRLPLCRGAGPTRHRRPRHAADGDQAVGRTRALRPLRSDRGHWIGGDERRLRA